MNVLLTSHSIAPWFRLSRCVSPLQAAGQRPAARDLMTHRFIAGTRRAAAQAALLPLIRRTRDHLSAASVRKYLERCWFNC